MCGDYNIVYSTLSTLSTIYKIRNTYQEYQSKLLDN